MKSLLLFFTGVLILSFMLPVDVNAKDNQNNKKGNTKKTLSANTQTYLDINNIFTPVYNNGQSDMNINSSLEGLVYPKGTGKTAVYSSGILWGAFVPNDPQVRVGGAEYLIGLEAGIIKADGTPDDPSSPIYRAYRVRPDIYPGGPSVDLTQDAVYEGTNFQALRTQYESDWQNWPGNQGAPYTDVNNDGIYEPGVDIPGVPGADQTIWYVANDMDANLTNTLFGTSPMGIELQVTMWAYKQQGALGNVYFKKYKLINKGYQHYTLSNMFVSLWADPDLGYAGDDLGGTDSTLGLIYTYNGSSTDAVYTPLPPPALGFHLLQGPVVNGNSTDTAYISGRKITGKKNLPLTASYLFINSNANYGDPPLGNPSGATQFYNFFNGKYGLTGQPFADPQGNKTKFIFPGDPVTGTGWIESNNFQPSDVRQGMAVGPFNMAPGDTQEVVFAEMLADKSNIQASYLSSITNLRNNVKYVNSYYKSGVSAIISCVDFININDNVNLNANVLPNSAQVSSINWSLLQKPNGSNASITNPSLINASFTPDLAGDYEVQLSLSINGISTTDIRTIKAVNNQPPKAILKIDTAEIASTDSLLLNYSESYDPDNDSLGFTLSGQGVFQYQNSSKTAYFYPYPNNLGNEEIQLIASDLYSYDSTAVKIKVSPVLKDVKINYSYIDTTWQLLLSNTNPLNGLQFFEGNDSLYVPMLNSLRRYQIKSDGIVLQEELSNIKITGIWAIKNNLLFASGNTNVGLFGTVGKLTIYNLSNGGSKVLTNYLPGTLDIMSFYQIDSDIYLRDYTNNIFKVDFSNPSAPQIVSSNQLPMYNASLFKHDSQYLYFLGITNSNTYSVYRLNRNTLATSGTLSLPFSPNNTLVIHDSILAAYNYSNPDSLHFYYFDGNNNPTLLKGISISTIFTNLYPHFYNSTLYGISFMDKYLEIDGYASSKLFDISDLNNIKQIASCYGGGMSYSRHGSNYFLMKSDPRFVNINNPYSGINEITLSLITGINNQSAANNIPREYTLYQNYPNPFNPETIIKYSIPKSGFVTIKVFDVLGRCVSTLVNEEKLTGNYSINFNAGSFASGVYFYRMQAGSFVETKKLILMK